MPTPDLASPRVPWKAALLGVLMSGLGQVYCGRALRAIIIHLFCGGFVFLMARAFFIPFKPWNIVAPIVCVLIAWLLVLGDAVRCARMAAPSYRLKAYNRWYVYLLLIVLAGLEQEGLRAFSHERIGQGFKVIAGSMVPTLINGDEVFVDKRAYVNRPPGRGDIVAFRYPPNPSILFFKRVIGVGGDVVKIERKNLFLNGKPLSEPYVQFETPYDLLPLRDNFPPNRSVLESLPAASGLDPKWKQEMASFMRNEGLQVPSGYVFVLGDWRDNSLDSRYWGFVPRADILGEARVIYFSWDTKGRRVRWERVGEILK